jgi:hypothetical protein
MSFLFSDLSSYIQHIPQKTSGIQISPGSDKKEQFTCGTHLNLQIIRNKTKFSYGCIKCVHNPIINEQNLLSSFMFQNLSSFIQHIPVNSSCVYITSNSHKKEYFTCGIHTNLQIISDKTRNDYRGCKICSNDVINNTNLLSSSILFTYLSVYISHIPKISTGINFSKGSHYKEEFTCGEHITLQVVSNKTKQLTGCNECVVYRSENLCRNILEELTNYKFSKKDNIDWLVNPNTDCYLEIDCCNLELKLGIEYNDHKTKCHTKQTDEKYEKLLTRDKIKQQLCKDNNFLLLYVPIEYTFKDKPKMKEFIKQLLIDNGKEDLLL